ncbi:MAG: hypothetical protein JW771_07140 [Candidatus Thermoplasmatota archaeon]|nr:hypothetical protein [Candidatus Thermoplasmatota archaeon]
MNKNIEVTQYLVIQNHTSEYPEPITFEKGATLVVDEKYSGTEAWDKWFFCESPGQKEDGFQHKSSIILMIKILVLLRPIPPEYVNIDDARSLKYFMQISA